MQLVNRPTFKGQSQIPSQVSLFKSSIQIDKSYTYVNQPCSPTCSVHLSPCKTPARPTCAHDIAAKKCLKITARLYLVQIQQCRALQLQIYV